MPSVGVPEGGSDRDGSGRRPDSLALLKHLIRGFVAFSTLFTTTCVMFAALNLLALPFLNRDPQKRIEELAAYRDEALSIAYPTLTAGERIELVDEFSMGFVPDPLVQVREAPVAGRFVNVAPEGYRLGLTQGKWPPDGQVFNIFFFGGSTAFGYGVADEDTIPSRLQVALDTVDGRPVRVYNVARGGYYSTQERIQFDKWATFGPRPDLAIFMDGLNENSFTRDPPYSTFSMTVKREHELASGMLATLRLLPVFRLFETTTNVGNVRHWGDGLRRDGTHKVDDPAKLVAERYRANREAIEAIGRVYGIRTAFVWQPVPKPFESYDRVKAMAAKGELGKSFFWCAQAGGSMSRKQKYIDRVHYSPAMSEIIAECIAAGLRGAELLP